MSPALPPGRDYFLIYVSAATALLSRRQLDPILSVSRRNHEAAG